MTIKEIDDFMTIKELDDYLTLKNDVSFESMKEYEEELKEIEGKRRRIVSCLCVCVCVIFSLFFFEVKMMLRSSG